jgi:hypothetical protein
LEEFLSSIESAARIGRWQDADKRGIAALKLVDSAKLFYQGCAELHEEDATWQRFKNAFRRRYEDVHTDQYHFTKLQTAKQGKKKRHRSSRIAVGEYPKILPARRMNPKPSAFIKRL